MSFNPIQSIMQKAGLDNISVTERPDLCYAWEVKWLKAGKVGSAIFEPDIIVNSKDVEALVLRAITAAEALEAIKS